MKLSRIGQIKLYKSAYVVSLLIILINVVINCSLPAPYYTASDIFGPLSVYPFVLCSEFIVCLLLMVVLMKYFSKDVFTFFLPSLNLIIIKYASLEFISKYYIVTFYDAWQLFDRGLYTTISGKTNPIVDPYFDVQSAFFWATSILLNVCGITPHPLNQQILMIAKYFPLFATLIYLVVLYLFFKHILNDRTSTIFGLFLFFALSLHSFHYASESYALTLYWVILYMAFRLLKKDHTKSDLIPLQVTCMSLIFLHQGVTIAMLLTNLTLALSSMPFKFALNRQRFSRVFSRVFVISVAAWFSYLSYSTLYTFKNFASTIEMLVSLWMLEGPTLFQRGLQRSYQLWELVVTCKAFYFSTLLFVGLLFSLIEIFKSKDENAKLCFNIQLFLSSFFIPIGIALGGAGYVERCFTYALPLIVYSVVNFMWNFWKKSSKRISIKVLLVVLLIILLIGGFIFYFAGRNFQSILQGTHYSRIFLRTNSPGNILGLYSGLKIISGSLDLMTLFTSTSKCDSAVIAVENHALVETCYYFIGDIAQTYRQVEKLYNSLSIIYNNLDAQIFVSPT